MSIHGGSKHHCIRHNRTDCTLSHQDTAYTRSYSTGASEDSIGIWVPEYQREIPPRPWWRWLVAGLTVGLLAGLIVMAAAYAGGAAADGFGPLLPTATPYPTPYPSGWTP